MTMPVAVRQCTATLTDDWITVEEAAALTGETERTWQRRAQWEAKQARTASRPSLAVQRSAESGGKPVWHVHRSIDARLTPCPRADERENRARPALLTKYPQDKVDRAHRKAYWLRQWRRACEGPQAAGLNEEAIAARIVTDAKQAEGEGFPIGYRSLQLWKRAYDAIGDDGAIRGVEALIDRRGDEPKGGGAHDGRSQEAIAYFYSLYHARQGFTVRTCHKTTLAKALENRWTWPASYAATTKWLRAYEKLDEACAYREGPTAYSKRYMPHIDIDYTALQPGEQYVIDHTRCDFWVREGDIQFRPWLTAMIDARSRLLVGWHLGRTPNQDGIVAALRMAFRDRAIPSRLHMDHGKDFLSSLLTGYTKREVNRLRAQHGPDWKTVVAHQQTTYWHGILAELEVETIAAIPYSPWSKALIERWYGTFQDQCSKTFATYCGRDPASKPECLEEIRYAGGDVPTLDEARTPVGEWIDLYNHTEHRGIDGEKPVAVWNRAESLRRASDKALVMLMQGRGVYRVGKNGVSFKVGSTTLTYGGSSVALRGFVGRDVMVTLDDKDCNCCYAYTADRRGRRLIGRLDCNLRVPANTPVEQLREAIRTVRGRRKIMAQARREQPAMIRNAAQEVRAMQAEERCRELRATGTDDHRPNVRPVRTGFEGQSMPVQTAFESIPDPYAAINLEDLLAPTKEPDEETDYDAWSDGIADLLPDRTDANGGEDTLAEFDE
jgi:transposase InsO family protein